MATISLLLAETRKLIKESRQALLRQRESSAVDRYDIERARIFVEKAKSDLTSKKE